MTTFIIIYLIGFIITSILLVNTVIRIHSQFTLRDLIMTILSSLLSWVALIFICKEIYNDSNFGDTILYKKKEVKKENEQVK